MPLKRFVLDEQLTITVYKRRGNRNLRLSLGANDEVRVSIPAWAPYSAGINFAKSRKAWIIAQRQPANSLRDGQAIGKAHHLRFQPSETVTKPTGRVGKGEVLVTYPLTLPPSDGTVQKVARAAGIRALRNQAEQLLPQRLEILATTHNFTYRGVEIKQLKGRWGSCDHNRHIVLNLFLMQLPWECIDYVLLHELTHTQIMKHGPEFWQAMESVQPATKALRKRLHTYRPVLLGAAETSGTVA